MKVQFQQILSFLSGEVLRRHLQIGLINHRTGLSTGLGAAISNLTAGFVVQAFGYAAGFLTLAAIALIALVFFAFLMPETQPDGALDGGSAVVPAA